jgi:threonine/homoserine/homoserine lactone efflux protein
MIPYESLVAFGLASVLLALAPGPDNVFVLTQSALYGRRAGIRVTLGLCTGLMAHTAVVALGIAAAIRASPPAFAVLKAAGAAYLLYLAWRAFSAAAIMPAGGGRLTGVRLYRRGVIMNVTNPKVTMFFLAFLPQFVSADKGAVATQIVMLGVLFMAVTLVVFGAVAALAGTIGAGLRASPKAGVYLNRIAGVVFVALAVKLAAGGIDG